MQIWAISNQKGGVGKTTTTLALARLLAASGQRVLLADLDPHASLTRAFGLPSEPAPPGVYELFESPDRDPRQNLSVTGVDNLSLLAAQSGMATLERRSASQPGFGMALSAGLNKLTEQFDYCLLDCPPTLGLLMVNALAAADRLIVPTQTEPLALHGMRGMLRTAQMIERSRKRELPSCVLPTLFDKRTKAGTSTLGELHDSDDQHTWMQAVPIDTRLRDASALCAPVLVNDLLSGRGFEAYARALQWLLRAQSGEVPTAQAPTDQAIEQEQVA